LKFNPTDLVIQSPTYANTERNEFLRPGQRNEYTSAKFNPCHLNTQGQPMWPVSLLAPRGVFCLFFWLEQATKEPPGSSPPHIACKVVYAVKPL